MTRCRTSRDELTAGLPAWTLGLTVRCPTRNPDGTLIHPDDVCGCGSTNLDWGQNEEHLYDCLDCGIWFPDYAADPPHRRELTDE